jgi:hypothetical protein
MTAVVEVVIFFTFFTKHKYNIDQLFSITFSSSSKGIGCTAERYCIYVWFYLKNRVVHSNNK